MRCTVASWQKAVVKRMLFIGIVSLALGVILGLAVPALSAERGAIFETAITLTPVP